MYRNARNNTDDVNEAYIKNYVDNKTIAVIGNAQSIFSKTNGKEIDSHDIVVRFNKGFIENKQSQGSKTNIVCSAINLRTHQLEQFNADICMYYRAQHKRPYKKVFTFPKDYIEYCAFKLQARPSTGFLAINYLLKFNSKLPIDLYGFDFNKTNTFYNKQTYKTPHKFEREEEFILDLVKKQKVSIM